MGPLINATDNGSGILALPFPSARPLGPIGFHHSLSGVETFCHDDSLKRQGELFFQKDGHKSLRWSISKRTSQQGSESVYVPRWLLENRCGARAHACRVHNRVNAVNVVPPYSLCVHTIVNTARTSACATLACAN